MDFVFWFFVSSLLAYLAYRCIRGGFERPQSAKLNGFGVIGCFVLIVVGTSRVWAVLS